MIGSLLFLLVLAVVAAVLFCLGFIRTIDPQGRYKPRFKGAFVVCVVFSGCWMWHIWNLTQTESQLSKYVVPYPGAKYTVTYGSLVAHDASWLATVDAPPDTVMSFYLSPKNVPGWAIAEENDSALVFRKDGAQMAIMVTDEGQSGSQIIYALTKRK